MGNRTSVANDIYSANTTNILQTQSSNCGATQNINASGNTIIVVDGNLKNVDVGISIAGQQVDATCAMTNTMDSQVKQLLETQLSQDISMESGLFGFLSPNKTKVRNDVTQSISNVLTQVTENNCSVSQNVNANNNYVYYSGVNSGAFIGVQISSQTASASCAMSNYSGLVVDSATKTNVDTDVDITKRSFFRTFFIIIIGVIILIVIVSLLTSFLKKGKPKEEEKEVNPTISSDELLAIATSL